MAWLDRFVATNTFIEVDLNTWFTKNTETVQLGHVVRIEKLDTTTRKKHRFSFLITTYGETGVDPESGIECLPHNSPLARVLLGLKAQVPTKVLLPAGEATVTVLGIRNPVQAELDRLLMPILKAEEQELEE